MNILYYKLCTYKIAVVLLFLPTLLLLQPNNVIIMKMSLAA